MTNHRGWATTLANVARGAVMMPINLEITFIGAVADAVGVAAVAIV
jgi:hypothetical protein